MKFTVGLTIHIDAEVQSEADEIVERLLQGTDAAKRMTIYNRFRYKVGPYKVRRRRKPKMETF